MRAGPQLHSNSPLTQLESSPNEIMAGQAFLYTQESWGTVRQTDCQPDAAYLNAPLRILGPFTSGESVNYQRTVSIHQYLVVRFELLKMGWERSSELNLTLGDQQGNTITAQTISSNSAAPLGTLSTT